MFSLNSGKAKCGSPFAIPRYAVQPDTEAIQLAMVIARRAGSEIY